MRFDEESIRRALEAIGVSLSEQKRIIEKLMGPKIRDANWDDSFFPWPLQRHHLLLSANLRTQLFHRMLTLP